MHLRINAHWNLEIISFSLILFWAGEGLLFDDFQRSVFLLREYVQGFQRSRIIVIENSMSPILIHRRLMNEIER